MLWHCAANLRVVGSNPAQACVSVGGFVISSEVRMKPINQILQNYSLDHKQLEVYLIKGFLL